MNASKRRTPREMPGPDIHISGAEGIYGAENIDKTCSDYIERALEHPRGRPDKIVITLESLKDRPVKAPILEIKTVECISPESAWNTIAERVSDIGISDRALSAALKVLRSEKTMRGAALMSSQSGKRLEPDRARGIRVSRLGIDGKSEKILRKKLAAKKIDTITVKEALILASKVVSCKDIIAEICISDDPDYTTGYLASRSTGYMRILNIKRLGEMHGGRVFFLRPDANIEKTINYLERKAVMLEFKKG